MDSSISQITENEQAPDRITIRAAGNEDTPASLEKDKLGFQPYVQAVFSYLKNPATVAPFTLSIEGDWGSGKSSFMCQLQQSLKNDKQRTISFNAWRHDKVESMWAAFALHFIKDLMESLSPLRRIEANLRLRWQRFDGIRGWFPLLKTAVLLVFFVAIAIEVFKHVSVEDLTKVMKDKKFEPSAWFSYLGSTGVLLGTLFFLSKVADVVGNPFKADLQKFIVSPNYEGNVAFIEEFHHDFDRTINILTKDKDKIFIFIDDLDRAEVPKAAELMQGLNMMISNSPRLIFIIGMDREKVAAGIASKYKDLLPFLNPKQQPLTTKLGMSQARDFGYKFLEKFVQLSFLMPKPSSTFTREFINSLSGVKAETGGPAPVRYKPMFTVVDGEDNKQLIDVTLLLAPFFEDNPRRLKQFVNAFRLKAHIANSTNLFKQSDTDTNRPLTIPQLGKFIALIMLWPELTDELMLDPNLLRQNREINDSSYNPWLEHPVFLRLLNLKPEYDLQAEPLYSMEYLDVRPLIETSPLYNPKKSNSATNSGGSVYEPQLRSDRDKKDVYRRRDNNESGTSSSGSSSQFIEAAEESLLEEPPYRKAKK